MVTELQLNPNQAEAVAWNDGPLLILAGPGSGKTATLTERVSRLLLESENETYRILCLTFTQKAAREMRERVFAKIPKNHKRVLLCTYHAFAVDILRQHGSYFGFKPDFSIINEEEQNEILREIVNKNKSDFSSILSPKMRLDSIKYVLTRVLSEEGIIEVSQDHELGQQVKNLFLAYKNHLQTENCLDFDAILYYCIQLLKSRPRLARQLRNIYKYICVDEFQDTNIAQSNLLRVLAPEKDANLFIVGDDDQVIYQWNGASPARLRELSNYYQLKVIQLPESYRCPEEVIGIANLLILNNPDRSINKDPLRAFKVKTSSNQDHPIKVLNYPNLAEEAQGIVAAIKAQLNSGAKPADIAVLARSTQLLSQVKQALEQAEIPAFLPMRKTQFESPPLILITNTLKLVVSPGDISLFSLVIQVLADIFEVEVNEKDFISLSDNLAGNYLTALKKWISKIEVIPNEFKNSFLHLNDENTTDFIKNIFAYFDAIENKKDHISTFDDYASEKQTWNHIISDLGGGFEAYLLPLGSLLQEIALANKTPEAPPNVIRCLTIHASKGMEFSHVYLMGMAEDQLPSYQSKKLGDNSREMQEERRSCFVAITRAIETLTFTYAESYKGWKKDPSRFLKEMGLIE